MLPKCVTCIGSSSILVEGGRMTGIGRVFSIDGTPSTTTHLRFRSTAGFGATRGWLSPAATH